MLAVLCFFTLTILSSIPKSAADQFESCMCDCTHSPAADIQNYHARCGSDALCWGDAASLSVVSCLVVCLDCPTFGNERAVHINESGFINCLQTGLSQPPPDMNSKTIQGWYESCGTNICEYLQFVDQSDLQVIVECLIKSSLPITADYCTDRPVCEFSNIVLACPNPDDVLVVDWALYAKMDSIVCTDGVPAAYLMNDKCMGFPTIRNRENAGHRCNNQNSCTLEASDLVFGDPCVGTFKNMKICYSCGKFYTAIGCEWKPLGGMSCQKDPGTVIEVHSATWGRMDNSTCVQDVDSKYLQNLNCVGESVSLEATLKKRCDGKLSCAPVCNNAMSDGIDPCRGTFKTMIVRYKCVPKQ